MVTCTSSLIFCVMSKYCSQRVKLSDRGVHSPDLRHTAGVGPVGEKALHMLHFFLSMATEERRRAFTAVIATLGVGAHLLIEQGRKELLVQLVVKLFSHFFFKHRSFLIGVKVGNVVNDKTS